MKIAAKKMATLFGAAAMVSSALANGVLENVMPDHVPFVVGGGVGVVPDYLGADETWTGAAPVARYQFAGSRRFVQWFINELQVNLLDDQTWAAGPVANLNLGRKDVKDDVVKLMNEVDWRMEYGAFLRYQSVDPSNPRNRLSASVTTMQRDESFRVRVGAQVFRQVSEAFDVNFGVGIWHGNTAANNAAVGVNPLNRGTSGLPDFYADSGINQYFFNTGVVMYLSRDWAVVGGAKYAHIPSGGNKPGSSPIVKDRGTNDIWAGGIGVMRMFW